MKIAEVRVSGCRCETVRLEPIPRGIVGAVVAVEYTDLAWDSLRKTVVFRGAATKDVLDAGNEIVIPAEVVSKAGGSLYMGVYGVDAENHVAIPTIWTELGVIQGAVLFLLRWHMILFHIEKLRAKQPHKIALGKSILLFG